MNDIKKGIEPTKENNTQTQADFNTIDWICLFEFLIAVVLVILGKYYHSDIMMVLGMGTGVASLPFQLMSIFRKEDETWE